jgi:hypothetical protein
MLVCLQFDVTFPGLPCEWISLDVMDISGEMHLDVVNLLACLPRPNCEVCCILFQTNKFRNACTTHERACKVPDLAGLV